MQTYVDPFDGKVHLIPSLTGDITSVGSVTTFNPTGGLINFSKSQVLDAFYRIITPANARLVLTFDQTGAVPTITDRSTIGGTTAHVVTLRDSSGNAINASTMTPGIAGLAPTLNFNASNNWDTPDATDLSFGNGATDLAVSFIALVKFNSPLTTQMLLAKSNAAISEQEYWILVYNTGYVFFDCFDNSVPGPAQIGRRTADSAVGTTAYQTIIVTKSTGVSASAIKIYVDGIQVDTTNDNSGVYVAMENLTPVVGSYDTGAGPVRESLGNYKAGFIGIVAEELSATQVKQMDTILRGWAGISFN